MVMSSFPINFESFAAKTEKLWPENKSKTKVWQNASSVSCNHLLKEHFLGHFQTSSQIFVHNFWLENGDSNLRKLFGDESLIDFITFLSSILKKSYFTMPKSPPKSVEVNGKFFKWLSTQ